MKDYSNYHNRTLKQQITNDGIKIFNLQLISEGKDALIDGIACRIIIHRTTNLISELKEERKVFCLDTVTMNRGSVVISENRTYLVTSAIESNGMFKKAKMVEISYTLKLKADDGNIYNIPTILRRTTNITLGTNEVKWMNLPDGKMEAQIPKTDLTALISRNKYNRFIIDNVAWRVSSADRVTQNGIINLVLQEEIVDSVVDNVVDNIANENKYKYNIEILNGSIVDLGIGQTLQIKCKVTQDNITIESPLITYTSSNPSSLSVDSNGLITAVQEGVNEVYIYYKNISTSITVNIESVHKDNFYAQIEGSSFIKVKDTAMYTVKFMNNSTQVYYPAVWSVTDVQGASLTDLVTIESVDVDSGICVLKTNDSFKKGTFILHVKDINNTINGQMKVNVISRF